MHCFDDVAAVVFVAALSEYNQAMFEDERTNRMSDALELWEKICAEPAFASSAIILFLNKRDLFAAKVREARERARERKRPRARGPRRARLGG